MVAATSPRPLCAEVADRSAEDGIWRSDRCLVAWSPPGMGRIAAVAGAARIGRVRASRAGAPGMAGTSLGGPGLGGPPVGPAVAAGGGRGRGGDRGAPKN